MSSETKIEEVEKDKLIGLYILVFIVTLLWLGSICLLPKYYPNLQDRGTFGDSFGAINSLFSGLAFACIIYTILLQRKELRLQRQELADTRAELKRSSDAQEKSERQLRRQSENLKISAKLNALGTLVNYYSHIEISTEGRQGLKDDHNEAINLQEEYINQIKQILRRKNQ